MDCQSEFPVNFTGVRVGVAGFEPALNPAEAQAQCGGLVRFTEGHEQLVDGFYPASGGADGALCAGQGGVAGDEIFEEQAIEFLAVAWAIRVDAAAAAGQSGAGLEEFRGRVCGGMVFFQAQAQPPEFVRIVLGLELAPAKNDPVAAKPAVQTKFVSAVCFVHVPPA